MGEQYIFIDVSKKLENISKLLQYYILVSTTKAGSGHVTSSLSAVDLMTVLFFDKFRFDWKKPNFINNDRLIFSKGHAAPLFYALWAVAGAIKKSELLTLRKFGSRLEGHPTIAFPFTEAGTGSLGQGLSIGLGMALNAKLEKLSYQTHVLMGDGEMAEGQIWEAMQLASYYKLDNLWAIVDVNRLGQSGETIIGHDLNKYAERCRAFGWEVLVIDGHDFLEIDKALKILRLFGAAGSAQLTTSQDKPKMILARTFKGKYVSFLENKENWHGKPLNESDLKKALKEIGKVDQKLIQKLKLPEKVKILHQKKIYRSPTSIDYKLGEEIATRKAYGDSLVKLGEANLNVVVLDGDTKNSTYSEFFKNKFPERFFEMFIAEQNMVGVAIGLSRRGKIPFVSTFAAFFTRAFDQIRMANYSNANIKFVGSHAGVSIGQDGVSQMGLEDLAMFRSILGSVVFYPSDAVSTEKLVKLMAEYFGIAYLRTTRAAMPMIYDKKENFTIGGSKVLRQSKKDVATIVAAGITLFEALKAYEELKKKNIFVRVIDLYSIKPVDKKTLLKAAKETGRIITVEDHYAEGGLGSAVLEALEGKFPVEVMAVKKMPKSGSPQELLDYEEISAKAIIKLCQKSF